MNVLVAPDSFKESLSAAKAAAAIRRGVKKALPSASVRCIPLGDGGEGTAEILTRALGGRFLRAKVRDPLGVLVTARWGYVGGARPLAVIEMAQASGLERVPAPLRNPLKTSTFGTGQLVLAALNRGCREIILCIGGSATVDAGLGMAQALGARFLFTRSPDFFPAGQNLPDLRRIDLSGMDGRLRGVKVRVACDVTNPLYGPRGAAFTFGPQKGATPAQVKFLDQGLRNFARVVKKDLKKNAADFPGAGAAGGLGAGLAVFLNARLESGIGLVLSLLKMEGHVRWADVVFTGEGRADAQSVLGKTPAGLARLSRRWGKPVVVLAGSIGPGVEKLYDAGVSIIMPVSDPSLTRQEAFRRTPRAIAQAAENVTLNLKYRVRLCETIK